MVMLLSTKFQQQALMMSYGRIYNLIEYIYTCRKSNAEIGGLRLNKCDNYRTRFTIEAIHN